MMIGAVLAGADDESVQVVEEIAAKWEWLSDPG